MIGLAIQVARCTPLVTWPIGTASQGGPGQRSRQRLRRHLAVRGATRRSRRADEPHRADRHVELVRQAGMRAEREERVAVDPHLLPDRPGARSRAAPRENASWPAGTGVWVVNTLWARTCRTASSNGVARR